MRSLARYRALLEAVESYVRCSRRHLSTTTLRRALNSNQPR